MFHPLTTFQPLKKITANLEPQNLAAAVGQLFVCMLTLLCLLKCSTKATECLIKLGCIAVIAMLIKDNVPVTGMRLCDFYCRSCILVITEHKHNKYHLKHRAFFVSVSYFHVTLWLQTILNY